MDFEASLHTRINWFSWLYDENDEWIFIRMIKPILIIGVDIRWRLVQNMAGDRCLAVSSHACHTQHVSYIDLDIFSLSLPSRCTASILNLCAISLDRYVAVTRPVTYPSIMSTRRAKSLIAGLWVLSFVICFPPLLGWNSSGEYKVRPKWEIEHVKYAHKECARVKQKIYVIVKMQCRCCCAYANKKKGNLHSLEQSHSSWFCISNANASFMSSLRSTNFTQF